MPLLHRPIPNLFGGVSQQAPQTRFPNQVEAMENATADPVKGLSKRPPSEHVKKIFNASAPNAHFFKIDRDPDNRFLGMIRSGEVKVFDILTGDEKTVTTASAAVTTYLSSADPVNDFRTTTVADYTFIVNKSKVTQASAATDAARPFEALLFVKAANYGKTFTATVRKVSDDTIIDTATYTTNNGDQPTDVTTIKTATIASSLAVGLNLVDTVSRVGSTIYLAHSEDFYIETSDDQGDTALVALKDKVQRFSDLPEKAYEGIVFEVAGDNTSAFDNYYVKFEDDVWTEISAPGLTYTFDTQTMPVALVRQPGNTFTVEALPWVRRNAGDDDTNPFPSFTGRSIQGVCYFKNRLGFLSDENIILSQAGDYFNFFRTTTTQLLDGDPIDTPASDASGESSPVSILEHAVAFDEELVLFARNSQFILRSPTVLTASEAELVSVTSYSASADCKPVYTGRRVYFAFERDGASGIREFYVDGVSRTKTADEVTAHVPTYLPAGAAQLAASTLENLMIFRSTSETNALYLYEWLWSGDQKLQSAWSKWTFASGDDIRFVEFYDSVAYLAVARTDGIYLERIQMRPDVTDTDLDYFTLLDRRLTGAHFTAAYIPEQNVTQFSLPFEPSSSFRVVTVKSQSDTHGPGRVYTPANISGSVLEVQGDISGYDVVIGDTYTFSVTPTAPYLQDGNGAVDSTAVLKLRDYSLDYTGTGYFTTTFSPQHRPSETLTFSGITLGEDELDVASLEEGTFRVPTPTRNTRWNLTINNDSPFPCRFLSASWRGLVESKSRRG